MSDSLRPHGPQHAKPPCPSPTPGVYPNTFRSLPKHMSIELVMPSNHLILFRPLLLLPSIFSGIRVFSNESTLRIRWLKYQSFSFNISPSNKLLRTDLIYDGLVGYPCSLRDSQESSPTPQFKNINSLALSFLYIQVFTTIHDYWKNHSLDKIDICWQSNVSAFYYAV